MFRTASRLVYFFTRSFRFTFRSLASILFAPFRLPSYLYNLTVAAMSAFTKRRPLQYVAKKDAVLDKLGVKTQVDSTCPICQEPIGSKSPEGITEGWSLLPCGHRFGSYCIKHYLNVVAEDRPSCPVCRQIAYHQCGHPVLPVILKPNGSTPDKIMESADLLVEEMKHSSCAFCQSPSRNPQAMVIEGGQIPQSRWKSLVGWVRVFPFTKRRRYARRQRLQAPTLVVTSQPATNEDTGAWTGPWMDPFPKQRDPLWEKWWKQQEPRGA
ncbi:hypothetical protein QBC37DRAFT_418029 [Rhypophila decipiens]|uniref:RING-type domain-containing protein n=1 Tax=Rhypophila decipiens TaxID=261697 RepID=A0AAN6YAV6_9PEZI|nr:hypothetical protein QBC37DRAFT_418029 [Rhypophila decipiens]